MAIAFVLGFAQTCLAADISVTKKQDLLFPPFVTIKGQIVRGDDRIFATVTNGIVTKGAVVFLISSGGSVDTATNIGSTIRGRGFQTAVADEATCTSACALIWLAGVQRFAGDRSYIGFHAAAPRSDITVTTSSLPIVQDFVPPSPKIDEAAYGNAMIGAYLNQLGFSRGTLLYVTKAGPGSLTWLTPEDARKHGIDYKPLDDWGSLAKRTTQR
jgi:hypothetical protein